MKKTIIMAFAGIMLCSMPMSAWNLRDALGALAGNSDSTSVSSGLGAALGNLLSTDRITIKQMEGVWAYSAPAVSFKTDDVLKKAGGAAASAVIVQKLEPFYVKTGFNKLQLTVNADSSFIFKSGKMTLKGNITTVPENSGSQANFIFNFSMGGKFNIGKIDAYVTKNAMGAMSLTFDVSKLIALMETVGNVSGNATLKATVSMLKSYDGLCAGFELKRTGNVSAAR